MSDENDPKDIEAMKAFAKDLADKMTTGKSSPTDNGKSEYGNLMEGSDEDHDAADHNKDTCPYCTVPKERENLLRTLENDVDALGWDQPAKLWGVLVDEDSGEEYLKMMRTLDGYAPDAIMKIAKKGRAKENVKGVVIAVEAWSYPDDVMRPLLQDSESYHALYNLLPPSEHPQRVERRAVTMFNRDGTYACVTRSRDGSPEMLAAVDPALSPPIAALLGMVPRAKKMSKKQRRASFRAAMKPFKTLAEIIALIEQIQDEMNDTMAEKGITQEEYLRELFEGMPEEVRNDLIESMPDDLKKMLGFDE